MHFGVTFPQTEIGTDSVAIRDYAQAASDLGFSHIVAGEHVLSPGYTHPKEVAPIGQPSMSHLLSSAISRPSLP